MGDEKSSSSPSIPSDLRAILEGQKNVILSAHMCLLRLLGVQGWRSGVAVARALASYQCGPGSIPRLGVICGLSLLVLYSAPRGFLRVLRFPFSSKTNI